MPIKSIITDYTGRKRDINIAFGIDPTNPDRQVLNLSFGAISTFCAGVQKLVQKYMILFLTAIGSQSQFPTFGTEFAGTIYSGNLASREDVLHAFNFANFSVLETLKAYQAKNPSLPLDEQISTALLNNLEVEGDRLSVEIRIVTNAGEDVDFLIPLPLNNT